MKYVRCGGVLALMSCVSFAQAPEYSLSSGELDIPQLQVDDGSTYAVTLRLIDASTMDFALIEAMKLPAFEARFGLVQNGLTRGDVVGILGMPESVSNLTVEDLPVCSEPPSLSAGTMYEQWEYGVDSTSQGPSGYVVWFAATTDPRRWRTVGKVEGYSCL